MFKIILMFCALQVLITIPVTARSFRTTISLNDSIDSWPRDAFFTKKEMVLLDQPDRSSVLRFGQMTSADISIMSPWRKLIDNAK
jgi:hypothetical protein